MKPSTWVRTPAPVSRCWNIATTFVEAHGKIDKLTFKLEPEQDTNAKR